MVNAYTFLTLAGILLTAFIWSRLTRRDDRIDGRLTLLYFCALLGAIVGAKLAFLLAEGWHCRDDWLALLTGRSILGGLLGGYAAVEWGKRWLRYPHATGDWFAIVVPLAIALGRVGCMIEGCCPGVACEPHWWTIADRAGVARWPAAGMELIFNALFLVWVAIAARRRWVPGNRFHVYLIAYGIFRFAHEFVRDEIHPFMGTGIYHVLALATAALGVMRFVSRRRETSTAAPPAPHIPGPPSASHTAHPAAASPREAQ